MSQNRCEGQSVLCPCDSSFLKIVDWFIHHVNAPKHTHSYASILHGYVRQVASSSAVTTVVCSGLISAHWKQVISVNKIAGFWVLEARGKSKPIFLFQWMFSSVMFMGMRVVIVAYVLQITVGCFSVNEISYSVSLSQTIIPVKSRMAVETKEVDTVICCPASKSNVESTSFTWQWTDYY